MTNSLKTFKEVQYGMFEHIKKEIYAQMGREWNYAGKDFDPLIHHLVSACAQQISDIYSSLNESEHRILSHLGKLLIPEANHVAIPAHSLARVSLNASSYTLNETLQFFSINRGKKFFFTPLMEGKLLNGVLDFIVSEQGIVRTSSSIKSKLTSEPVQIGHLLLGFAFDALPDSLEDAIFYFNIDTPQKASLFLDAVTDGQWIIGNKEIRKTKGITDPSGIEDFTDLDVQLVRRLAPIFDRNFVKIIDPVNLKDAITDPLTMISTWAEHHQIKLDDGYQSIKAQPGKSQYLWIEINLPHYVWVADLAKRFECSTTTFPVVNRELKRKDDADTYFNQVLTNIVQLTSDKPIIGIRRVYDKETGTTFYRSSITSFYQKSDPTYCTRYAGVGRVDKFNAWRRYLYLISLLREESKISEFIKKVSSEISLEELHYLIREKTEASVNSENASDGNDYVQYIFLYPGESGAGMAVAIEFWATQGSQANNLPAGLSLQTLKPIPGLLKDDIGNVATLLQTTLGGSDALSETELFEHLRDIVQRRDRIVTTADAHSFLKIRLGNQLYRVDAANGVELDPRPGFGLARKIDLALHVVDPEDASWKATLEELEHVVNGKSNLLIPFRLHLA